MNWNDFAVATDFKKIVYKITEQSIDIVLSSDIEHHDFQAFAFNCSSYSGDISLSFGVCPGYADKNKKQRLYPPDWEYETIESELQDVQDLWKNHYDPIQLKYQEIVENLDDIEDFSNGFLESLRLVMVLLERDGIVKNLAKNLFGHLLQK